MQVVFETGSHYISLAALEFVFQTRQAGVELIGICLPLISECGD